jgi:hypothetical protein
MHRLSWLGTVYMAIWREFEGWTYEFFDRDIEPEALPGFEDLVSLGSRETEAGGGEMPGMLVPVTVMAAVIRADGFYTGSCELDCFRCVGLRRETT